MRDCIGSTDGCSVVALTTLRSSLASSTPLTAHSPLAPGSKRLSDIMDGGVGGSGFLRGERLGDVEFGVVKVSLLGLPLDTSLEMVGLG